MNDTTDHRSQDSNSASAFYCNMEALSPLDRARHQSVTQQLLLTVKEMKELPDGLALRFDADDQSIMLVSEFMTRERVCCPVLSFTIAVGPQDGPLWLHLRGEEGVKEFIKTELGL